MPIVSLDEAARSTADALRSAHGLVIASGAGMGVDSGLPDFRGPEGFWRAYPAYRALGLAFEDMANPRWFTDDPHLAWGFYGHRLNLYRDTVPHDGFRKALAISSRLAHGAFAFTSNVDGQLQRAGFTNVAEVHGAIGRMQCVKNGACGVWPAPADLRVDVDPVAFRARDPLPVCPTCGALARPNILMFGDWQWLDQETDTQLERLNAWVSEVGAHKLVVIECGAGTAIPTVRYFTEGMATRGAHCVRLNVREAEGPEGVLGVSVGAREGLVAIERAFTSLK